jgi:hypothetical protein
MQVPEGPQSWEGGQPPQVPPQPSSPQVFAVQLALLQLVAGPPSEVPPEDELPDEPSGVPVPPLDEPPPSPPDEPTVPSSLPAASAAPEDPPSPVAV